MAIGGPAPSLAAAAPVRPVMDERRFEAFYESTSRRLWSYLVRASGSASVADDLLQESYYRLLKADFTAESDEHRKNYLYRIATNLLRDRYRRRRSLRPVEESDAVADPSPSMGLADDLGRMMRRLSPRDRQILWLAHVEGFRHREIAGILGVKEGSVRLMLFRARKRLAKRLEESGWQPEESR